MSVVAVGMVVLRHVGEPVEGELPVRSVFEPPSGVWLSHETRPVLPLWSTQVARHRPVVVLPSATQCSRPLTEAIRLRRRSTTWGLKMSADDEPVASTDDVGERIDLTDDREVDLRDGAPVPGEPLYGDTRDQSALLRDEGAGLRDRAADLRDQAAFLRDEAAELRPGYCSR